MKREFLKELELSDETIDKIMAEYGKDVQKHKETAETSKAELEAAKGQLAEASKQIEDFKGMDIDGIKQAAEDWKSKAEQAQKDAESKIQSMQLNHLIDTALSGAKAKNPKAVRALLDMEGLKLNNGEVVGLSEQVEKIKADNDYLFEVDATAPKFSASTPGTGTTKSTKDMTYSEMVSFLSKNPTAEI